MSTTQQQDAPKCTAADGLAEIFNVPGHPLLVRAVDFNRLHAENETLRMGYAAARLEIESLKAQSAGAQPAAQPSYEHQRAIMEGERNASLDAYSRVVSITSAESRLYERAFTSGWDRRDRLASYGQAPAQAAPAAVAGPSRDLHPEKCPITGRPFFMTLDHPELGDVPTYGGPYDSYTIPTPEGEPTDPWHERELRSERYDHDAGWWVEGGEPIPLRIVHEDVLFKLQEDAEAAAPTTQPAPQQEASPTTGMNIAQRILHVGGRNNAAGYVEFGSIQAVEALVRQVLRDLPSAPQPSPATQGDALTQAARDVLAERQRQISAEGYDADHDDAHVNDEIAAMAALFVMPPGAREWDASSTSYGDTLAEAILPQDWEMPALGDRRRELVKGAALALAELERIDRADAARAAQEGK